MNYEESTFCEHETFKLRNYLPHIEKDRDAADIISGLTSRNKHISCIYFYDAIGSKLFEEITQLPEYYLTRIEKDLLQEASVQICSKLEDANIIEFGSGDCSKISILLDAVPEADLKTIRYIPVDISQAAIEESALTLITLFPGLEIHGKVADFAAQLSCIPEKAKRLFCFLGSTIGNFQDGQSVAFLRNLSKIMHCDDMLLVGFDMVKSKDIIEKAYNDSRHVTAEFNRNILIVVNDLVGTNFEPNTFEHVAFYNEECSRIEMHLKAIKDLEISCPHLPNTIFIERGETIHTENSHKYTEEHIDELLSKAGLAIQNKFMDRNKWYSLVRLRKA